jgi:hypothetical protein
MKVLSTMHDKLLTLEIPSRESVYTPSYYLTIGSRAVENSCEVNHTVSFRSTAGPPKKTVNSDRVESQVVASTLREETNLE